MNQRRTGVLLAISAYSLWSLAPIYFKALADVSALEILAHRVIWSFLLTLGVLYAFSMQAKLFSVLKNRRALLGLLLSTILIGMNWGVFIWAVQDNRILSASLGYYINPLVSIMLGMLFLSEKLDVVRKIASCLCVFAVVFEVVNFGSVPYVALFLACTFGLYGLVRKKLGIDSFTGLTIETALLCPLALVYLFLTPNDAARFVGNTWDVNLLLILAGPVTTIPLICFSAAANRISLTAMGFFQYIAPTGMFVLAVLVYNEDISVEKLITFVLIWLALLLLVMNSAYKFFRVKNAAPI